ncbi:stabilin-2-like, partial [Rhinophrynus dorsalis]
MQEIESSEEKFTIFVPGNAAVVKYCNESGTEQLTYVHDIPLDGAFYETKNGMLMGISRVLPIVKNRCDTLQSLVKKVPGCCTGYFGHQCLPCPGLPGNICSNNGVCHDGINGDGDCICTEGFHGTACETCEPGRYGTDCKSECECVHGRCNDGLRGDGTCQCDKGWSGYTCERKINACLHYNGGCHPLAECIKTGPNKVACNCQPGYEGDGIENCTSINLCTQNNGGCSPKAQCTPTGPSQRSCTCSASYIGDGVICRGNVYQELAHDPEAAPFYNALLNEGIIRHIRSEGSFTVFVPVQTAITNSTT